MGQAVRAGLDSGSLATAARAATSAPVAHARAPLETPLILVGPGHPKPDRRGAGPLVANPDVVHLATALDLAPAVGEQVLVPPGGALSKVLRVRDLQVEALDANFLVIRHGAQG